MRYRSFIIHSIKQSKPNAFNPLPNSKTLGWSKLKQFADEKINVTEKLKFGRVKNIVGKGENAAFSPFPPMFSKGFLYRVIKCLDCVVKGEVDT